MKENLGIYVSFFTYALVILRGALYGMVVGALGVIAWESFSLYALTGLSAIVPCFFFASFVIVLVSLCDRAPEQSVVETFMRAKQLQ